MRKILIVVTLLAAAACAGSTTAPQHRDGPCKSGYILSSGGVCVPEQRIPATHAPSLDVGDPCTTPDGRSGYTVSAGLTTYCQPN